MNVQMTEEETRKVFIEDLGQVIYNVLADTEQLIKLGHVNAGDVKEVTNRVVWSVLNLLDGTKINKWGYHLEVNIGDAERQYMEKVGMRLPYMGNIAGELHDLISIDSSPTVPVNRTTCHITENEWENRWDTHILVMVPYDVSSDLGTTAVMEYLKNNLFDFVYWGTSPFQMKATHLDMSKVMQLCKDIPGTYIVNHTN